MIKILLKMIMVCTIFITSIAAQAGVIALEDWFDPAGSNSGGLTQSQFSDSLYFAVAQNVDFSTTDTYEVTEGWHVATYVEYNNLHSAYIGTLTGRNMYDQDGWNGSTTASGATNQYYFALADMFDASIINRAVHAGNAAYYNGSAFVTYGNSLSTSGQSNFAGLIVIQDTNQQWGSAQAVPEPSTLAIFALGMIGLASRRFKK